MQDLSTVIHGRELVKRKLNPYLSGFNPREMLGEREGLLVDHLLSEFRMRAKKGLYSAMSRSIGGGFLNYYGDGIWTCQDNSFI